MAAETAAEAASTPGIPPASLEFFPNEIILHILYFLPPEDNLLCFQLLSKHLNDLANKPLLWRHHCSNSFKYWNPDHEFQKKLEGPVSDADWKRLFIVRKQRNARIAHLFDGILATKLGRLRKFEQICHLGYDAKDFLLDQCHVDDSVDDVLARRYHANSILDSIHREVAIKEWMSFPRDIEPADWNDSARVSGNRSLNTTIERCLAAFDMFILHDQPGDLSQLLDNLVARFESAYPDFNGMPTRIKALTLNRWLRSQRLLGMDSPVRNYRRLRNCFIGQALRHKPHQSLPLISSAIYCSVAERLGLDAQPCLFPSHVHTLIFSPPGISLDGLPILPPEGPQEQAPLKESMHLDPYGKDDEVPRSFLLSILANFGWQSNADIFLSPAQPRNLIMRTAHNIRATFAADLSGPQNPEPYIPAADTSRPVSGSSVINRDSAILAFIWARLILLPPNGLEWVDSLHRIFDRFTSSWIGDTWLLEKYICPLYDMVGPHGQVWDNPRNLIKTKRNLDDRRPPARRRDGTTANIAYRVGQVFRHRRLNFLGVITGWADDGPLLVPGDSIAPFLDVDGATASVYYMCMRMDSLTQVKVLQDAIIPVNDKAQIPDELFELAGLYFKRFDQTTGMFVSNIREEYPDD